jgi:hypothetical protein
MSGSERESIKTDNRTETDTDRDSDTPTADEAVEAIDEFIAGDRSAESVNETIAEFEQTEQQQSDSSSSSSTRHRHRQAVAMAVAL